MVLKKKNKVGMTRGNWGSILGLWLADGGLGILKFTSCHFVPHIASYKTRPSTLPYRISHPIILVKVAIYWKLFKIGRFQR